MKGPSGHFSAFSVPCSGPQGLGQDSGAELHVRWNPHDTQSSGLPIYPHFTNRTTEVSRKSATWEARWCHKCRLHLSSVSFSSGHRATISVSFLITKKKMFSPQDLQKAEDKQFFSRMYTYLCTEAKALHDGGSLCPSTPCGPVEWFGDESYSASHESQHSVLNHFAIINNTDTPQEAGTHKQ